MTGQHHGEQAIPHGVRSAHIVAGRGPFGEVVRLAEVDSTNRVALDAAAAGEPEGLVVLADLQTSGRGRLGRRWSAPAGSAVLCSMLFRPRFASGDLHLLPTVVALAARQACAEVAGVAAGLKWPNDLLAGSGRKLAGILTEVAAAGRHGVDGPAVVVGVGINVSWPRHPAEPDGDLELAALTATATSLEIEAGRRIDRDAVVTRLLAGVNDRYARLLASPPGSTARPAAAARVALMGEYRGACLTVGEPVKVELIDETFSGTALDVNDDGALLVSTRACLRTVESGDVVHLR